MLFCTPFCFFFRCCKLANKKLWIVIEVYLDKDYCRDFVEDYEFIKMMLYLILILNSICICISMEMCVDGILYYYEVYALSVDRTMYGHIYYVE